MSWVASHFETIRRFLESRKGIHFADGFAGIPNVFSVEKTPIGIRLDNCRVYGEAELDALMGIVVERVARHERTLDNKWRKNTP